MCSPNAQYPQRFRSKMEDRTSRGGCSCIRSDRRKVWLLQHSRCAITKTRTHCCYTSINNHLTASTTTTTPTDTKPCEKHEPTAAESLQLPTRHPEYPTNFPCSVQIPEHTKHNEHFISTHTGKSTHYQR